MFSVDAFEFLDVYTVFDSKEVFAEFRLIAKYLVMFDVN